MIAIQLRGEFTQTSLATINEKLKRALGKEGGQILVELIHSTAINRSKEKQWIVEIINTEEDKKQKIITLLEDYRKEKSMKQIIVLETINGIKKITIIEKK